MEQLIMMSNKTKRNHGYKTRLIKGLPNPFLSWNKANDNVCVPLKVKDSNKIQFSSSKKIRLAPFPKLEDQKVTQKRHSSSFKLLAPNNNRKINDQKRLNNILPKINLSNSSFLDNSNNNNNNHNDSKRKSFSFFKNNIKKQNSLEKKFIKKYCALSEAGKDRKLLRMYGEECEINPKGGEIPLRQYKTMMINDQNDCESVKKYIMFMKLSVDLNDKQTINDYIDLWNQYLEAFMNDPDAYNELAQVYLMVNEYDKAAFCLEELLLYSPNDYKVLNKLGDIYTSKNNSEDAKMGIKFYSRSILIQPTPRAFFGIQNCASIIIKKEKRLDDKTKKLVDISKKELTKLYADTEFKNFDVNKIFNV